MTSRRALDGIVATTDVHSSFHRPAPMLGYLHEARRRALIVDCGDFFEGSGYYRLGGGDIERRALVLLYDVLAPGNHGWRHHFEPDLRPMTVCANTIDAGTGEPLFRPIRIEQISGRRVGITGVIGEQAFATIPPAERRGHEAVPPRAALHELRQRYRTAVDDWIVLSHSGFDHDRALAAACPFVSVIFSGHCHSDQYGPVRAHDTLIVKGRDLGQGYALATPGEHGWTAHPATFPQTTTVAEPLTPLMSRLEGLHDRLTKPLGTIAEPFRGTTLDRRHLLTVLARRLHALSPAQAVLLNETSLRPTPLGTVLREGDLLAIEPFANHLVLAHLAPATGDDQDTFLDTLTAQVGPLVLHRDTNTTELRCALTTRYLADTFLGGRWNGPTMALAPFVSALLTGQMGERP